MEGFLQEEVGVEGVLGLRGVGGLGVRIAAGRNGSGWRLAPVLPVADTCVMMVMRESERAVVLLETAACCLPEFIFTSSLNT